MASSTTNVYDALSEFAGLFNDPHSPIAIAYADALGRTITACGGLRSAGGPADDPAPCWRDLATHLRRLADLAEVLAEQAHAY